MGWYSYMFFSIFSWRTHIIQSFSGAVFWFMAKLESTRNYQENNCDYWKSHIPRLLAGCSLPPSGSHAEPRPRCSDSSVFLTVSVSTIRWFIDLHNTEGTKLPSFSADVPSTPTNTKTVKYTMYIYIYIPLLFWLNVSHFNKHKHHHLGEKDDTHVHVRSYIKIKSN